MDCCNYIVQLVNYFSHQKAVDPHVVHFKAQGVGRRAISPTGECLDEHGDRCCPTGRDNERLGLTFVIEYGLPTLGCYYHLGPRVSFECAIEKSHICTVISQLEKSRCNI